jgi:hypothetical protein
LSEASTGRLKRIPISDRNNAPRGEEIFLKTPEKLLNFKEDPPLLTTKRFPGASWGVRSPLHKVVRLRLLIVIEARPGNRRFGAR